MANYQASPKLANYPAPQNIDPVHPHPTPSPATSFPTIPVKPRHLARRIVLGFLVALLVFLLVVVFWGFVLIHRVEDNLGRTDALSGAPDTPGTTWLIAGSDSREGFANDGTEGQRSDSIILVHQAANGKAFVISLPRDTYVKIPGKGHNKLNAAFSWGGQTLLVKTVEGLTGLTVDHYVQVGMNGVAKIVDGLGGVNLCWNQSFNDRMTGLSWQAGCHDVDGNTALSFSRMRYADPLGDIGRTQRQRLVISAVLHEAISPKVALSPGRQLALADAGAKALTVDRQMGAIDIAKLALAMKQASADGLQGVPPIASMGYNPGGGVGSTVLLDPDKSPGFFQKLASGTLTSKDLKPQF